MTDDRPSVGLFVRSLTPSGTAKQQEAILDTVNHLDDRDTIDDYEVTVWGERIVPDSLAAATTPGQRIMETIDAFETWAKANDAAIDRFFEEQAIESAVTGECYIATRLPMLAMAEYVDGEIRMVTPHVDDDGVLTVADRVTTLGEEVAIENGQATVPAV